MFKYLILGVTVIGIGVMVFCYTTYAKMYGSLHTDQPIQMSLIDVQEEISTDCEMEIKQSIKHFEGVEHVFVNRDSRKVVYSHYPKEASSIEVFNHLKKSSGLRMTRYQPILEEVVGGCPVTGPSTLTMKMGGKIWSLIH